MRHSLAEADARRLLAGGPVVLVTTAWHGNANVMPAAYVVPLSFDPPLLGLAVHPARHTHDMIRFSEEFALNVPGPRLLHHCQYLASVSGRDVNKLDLTRLPTFRARKVEAPLLEGCVGWIECGLHDAYRIGDHTLFIGLVAAAQVEKEAFEETWLLPEDEELRPLHYLGINYYAQLATRLEARIPQPEAEETVEEAIDQGVEQVEEEERRRSEGG